MTNIVFLSTEDLKRLHVALAGLYGGSPKIRDENVLEALVKATETAFDGHIWQSSLVDLASSYLVPVFKYNSIVEMATLQLNNMVQKRTVYDIGAAYLYYIIKQKPFKGGNQQTAAAALAVFMLRNGYKLEVTDEGFINAVTDVASGELSYPALAAVVKGWSRRV